MSGVKLRKTPQLNPGPSSNSDHPFSLLTLIQNAAAGPSHGVRALSSKVLTRPAGVEPKDDDEDTDYVTDPGHLDNDDIYRLPQYQSQPADLSLNSEQFDSPNIFFRSGPSHHHQPQYHHDSYYGGPGGGQPGDYFPYSDQDYYSRSLYTGYEDTSSRMYEFPPANNTCSRYDQPIIPYPPPAPPPAQLQPPPLHPSPAVLLHIKYVMESVCDSMSFTDVTIITSSDTLRAHRSILSAHSTFLNFIFSTNTNADLQEDPVIFFPSYSSLYVRMLLQFFYTGEVTTMTQKDIEPLREICYSLGISSLMTRLDDVKLSISFQNIPSYDSHIPPVDAVDNKPDDDVIKDIPQQHNIEAEFVDKPSSSHSVEFKPADQDNLQPTTASCKFQEPREKQKLQRRDSSEVCEPRRYTVVSKMPKDTALQVSMKCSKCEMKFFKREILEEHLKLHEGIRPKECHICKKTFNTNYHLTTHMRIHSGEKPFSCAHKDCGKEFSDSSSLRRHQQIHSGQKPFKCKICGKLFTDRSSGRRHEKSHDSDLSFNCNVCGKAFTRKAQLRKHKENLHSVSEVPASKLVSTTIFECKECKAVFKTKSKLDQHTKVHTGEKTFKCDKCEKSFARKSNLQLHIRTHTGEKPHACARCGRCFSDVSAFRRHCRTHSGERPYDCKNCGNSFTQASTLHNHKRTCRQKKIIDN